MNAMVGSSILGNEIFKLLDKEAHVVFKKKEIKMLYKTTSLFLQCCTRARD